MARSDRRPRRRTATRALTPAVLWVCRAEALALIAGALVIVVLTQTSHATHSVGFLVADAAFAILLALLLTAGALRSWARTPVLMVQVLAVLVSTQLWTSGRHGVALCVGLPGLVTAILILRDVRRR